MTACGLDWQVSWCSQGTVALPIILGQQCAAGCFEVLLRCDGKPVLRNAKLKVAEFVNTLA